MKTSLLENNTLEEEKNPGWTMTFTPGIPSEKPVTTPLSESEKGRVMMILSGHCPDCGLSVIGGLCTTCNRPR